jgi:hypothetical protein
MIAVQEEVREASEVAAARYRVDQKVLWKVLRNSPKHYMPGEKLCGTIICVFDNGGTPTYRIRLDICWNEAAPDQNVGAPIVVGNVRESCMSPICE